MRAKVELTGGLEVSNPLWSYLKAAHLAFSLSQGGVRSFYYYYPCRMAGGRRATRVKL